MSLVIPQLIKLVPKGGAGSGNFGHGGRPGQRGGSATGTGGRTGTASKFSKESAARTKAFHEQDREHEDDGKTKYWNRAAREADINIIVAHRIQETWETMTHSVGQQQLQEAAAKEFGLETPEWHKTQGKELLARREAILAKGEELPLELETIGEQSWNYVEKHSTPEEVRYERYSPFEASKVKTPEQLWGKNGNEEAGVRAYLRSTYNITQQELSAAGIKEVSVYRGIRTASPLGKSGDKFAIGSQNPLVSWSPELKKSEHFAKLKKTKQKVKLPKHGTVLQTSIPARDVFSIFGTGLGFPPEIEFVVLGRQGHVAEITSTH